MRHALFEAANSHLRRSKKWSVLRAWGVKLAQRVGARKACVAVARKLAIIMHRMWIEQTRCKLGRPNSPNPIMERAAGLTPDRSVDQAEVEQRRRRSCGNDRYPKGGDATRLRSRAYACE